MDVSGHRQNNLFKIIFFGVATGGEDTGYMYPRLTVREDMPCICPPPNHTHSCKYIPVSQHKEREAIWRHSHIMQENPSAAGVRPGPHWELTAWAPARGGAGWASAHSGKKSGWAWPTLEILAVV